MLTENERNQRFALDWARLWPHGTDDEYASLLDRFFDDIEGGSDPHEASMKLAISAMNLLGMTVNLVAAAWKKTPNEMFDAIKSRIGA